MDASQIERIAVVGAGLMGHGIAQEFALAGYQVRLHDLSDDRLAPRWRTSGPTCKGCRRWAASRQIGSTRHSERSPRAPILEAAVSGAELVIEAIVEELGAKHALLRSLETLCGQDTLIASNTSSFMPSRLAEAVSPRTACWWLTTSIHRT